MNYFPQDRILWAGIGNNPPADSSYWKEIWAINLAIGEACHEKTWKAYCSRG